MSQTWPIAIIAAAPVGFLLGWFGVWPLINRLTRGNTRRKEHNDQLNASITAHPAGRGHRGGTEAHRTGTGGSAGDSTSAGGTRARVTSTVISPLIHRAFPSSFDGPEHTLTRQDGPDLAIGGVRGARSFRINEAGMLTGVVFRTVWGAGENQAECKLRADHLMYAGYLYQMRLRGMEPADPNTAHPLTACQHGFYAYYDGSNDYYQAGFVSAVVEGYGETVIGTRGFRCMKARIVALHFPDEVGEDVRRRVVANYPGAPVFDTFERMVTEVPPDAGDNA